MKLKKGAVFKKFIFFSMVSATRAMMPLKRTDEGNFFAGIF